MRIEIPKDATPQEWEAAMDKLEGGVKGLIRDLRVENVRLREELAQAEARNVSLAAQIE